MAAVDADRYGPYDAGPGADWLETDWRMQASWFATDGIKRNESVGSGQASATGGRSLTIDACRCQVRGQAAEFSTANAMPFAANASGNPRVDLVIIRNDFVANKFQMDVLQGTPAGSPVAPTPTQNTAKWEIPLYEVTCTAGFTSLALTDTKDVRRWSQGSPPGGPFLATCASTRTTSLNCTTGVWTPIPFSDGEDYDTVGMHSTSSNPSRFTIPSGMAGLWSFTISTAWAPNATNDRGIQVWKNGGLLESGPIHGSAGPSVNTMLNRPYEDVFAVGDYVEFYASHDAGGTLQLVRARATCLFRGYLG